MHSLFLMTRRHWVGRFQVALALVLTFAAPAPAADSARPPLTVFVSVLPQKYLAGRIAGPGVEVLVMVGPGQSPATYEPSPKQMARLGGARFYFSVGAPFESVWLPRITAANKKTEFINTTEGIALRALPAHDHAGGGREARPERDPHAWTSPLAAREMAQRMTAALAEADPARAGEYRDRFEILSAELTALDERIHRLLESVARRTFFVFHPSWGYFADAYGLEQVAIEQGGGEPGARHLAGLIERARREKIGVIFAQPQFDRRNAATVAEAIGGRIVVIDPLAEDYIVNLERVAATLAEVLQ